MTNKLFGVEHRSIPEIINLQDACLYWYPCFLSNADADILFQLLLAETPWRQDTIRMHGKELPVPRLQAWYGEEKAHYAYSGISLAPLPFTPALRQICEQIADVAEQQFNAVLLNYYRNGEDSVSWHSDDEKELGVDPVIASLSLGCSRRFEMKHRSGAKQKPLSLELSHGSLLVMGAGMQRHWMHQIPKQRAIGEARINLTFRLIL